MSIILTSKDTPFTKEHLAQNTIKSKGLVGAKVIEVDGGFAIDDGKEEVVQETVAPIETTVKEAPKQPEKPKLPYEITEEDDEETIAILSGSFKSVTDIRSIIDPYRDPRFVYKWANPKLDMGERIAKLKSQGWQVDPVMHDKIKHLTEYRDNSNSLDTTVRVHGHILMRLPRHMAAQREKYYLDMANNGIAQLDESLEKGTPGIYGDVHVSVS